MNTEALRTAREALGQTQTDLAQSSGLPQPELSRWERGLRVPRPEQLEQLAEALKVPVDFLLSDERITRPVHRTQRHETKRIERQVNGRLELARRAAARLLGDIHIDAPFSFPTIEDALVADPEAAAAAVRRVWRVPPGPIDDLTAIVESAGAVVLRVDFGHSNIRAAYVNPRGDHRWCFLNSRANDGAPVRFDLAHELGHALLHWDRFDASDGKDAEIQAHRFAAALLMPAQDIAPIFARARPTLNELLHLRARWGVSVAALIRRAYDLGYLTEQSYTRLYKQLSAKGWRSARGEPGKLAIEEPHILSQAIEVHRDQHGYTEEELAYVAGLARDRLADLLPDHFTAERRQVHLRSLAGGRSDGLRPSS